MLNSGETVPLVEGATSEMKTLYEDYLSCTRYGRTSWSSWFACSVLLPDYPHVLNVTTSQRDMDSGSYLCMTIPAIKRRNLGSWGNHNMQIMLLWKFKIFAPLDHDPNRYKYILILIEKGRASNYHQKHTIHKYSLYYSYKDTYFSRSSVFG